MPRAANFAAVKPEAIARLRKVRGEFLDVLLRACEQRDLTPLGRELSSE